MGKRFQGMDPAKVKYLSEEELDNFRKVIKKSPRDDALFNLAYSLGLRVSEIHRLQIADINFEEGQIRVIRSKSGRNRVYTLHPILVKKLEET